MGTKYMGPAVRARINQGIPASVRDRHPYIFWVRGRLLNDPGRTREPRGFVAWHDLTLRESDELPAARTHAAFAYLAFKTQRWYLIDLRVARAAGLLSKEHLDSPAEYGLAGGKGDRADHWGKSDVTFAFLPIFELRAAGCIIDEGPLS